MCARAVCTRKELGGCTRAQKAVKLDPRAKDEEAVRDVRGAHVCVHRVEEKTGEWQPAGP